MHFSLNDNLFMLADEVTMHPESLFYLWTYRENVVSFLSDGLMDVRRILSGWSGMLVLERNNFCIAVVFAPRTRRKGSHSGPKT